MNVWNLLAAAAAAWPDRRALGQGDRQLTYSHATAAARALASELRQRGVCPGDRVACLMHNGIDHFLAYYGIAAAGAILVSLNTRLLRDEQLDILRHAGANLLLHDGDHGERACQLATMRPMTVLAARPDGPTDDGPTDDGPTDDSPTDDSPDELPLASGDAPAQLYYTSGTTGRPKGVILTHDNVCRHALAATAELGLTGEDTWAHIAPMFHLADAWATFAITGVGGRHVFLPHFKPAAALDLLVDERVTITNLVPTMLNLMVKHPGAAARHYSLRVMLSGGASIAPDVVRRILATFACDYVQTYGMTETSPYLTLSLLPPELRRLPLDEQLRFKCKTGRAFAGIELRVVDTEGRDVPTDGRTVGEIRVRGATVTPGYWQDPSATSTAFDEHGFLRTGDLANIDGHGFVDIVDRQKDVIKTGGETVYSVEVEHALYEHPAVLECAVVGLTDETWGERVVAAVVLRPGQDADADALIAFCRARIAAYKAPKQIFFRDALPRTGSGKIQKRVLRDLLA